MRDVVFWLNSLNFRLCTEIIQIYWCCCIQYEKKNVIFFHLSFDIPLFACDKSNRYNYVYCVIQLISFDTEHRKFSVNSCPAVNATPFYKPNELYTIINGIYVNFVKSYNLSIGRDTRDMHTGSWIKKKKKTKFKWR